MIGEYGDAAVEARDLHVGVQAGALEVVPLSLAAGVDEEPQERELGGLENVLRAQAPARPTTMSPAMCTPGTRSQSSAEDVLRHHELRHALVAADAGVQVGEVRPRR